MIIVNLEFILTKSSIDQQRFFLFAIQKLYSRDTFIKNKIMELGAFSNSLSVKDLSASKQFYEHLGFSVFGGQMEKNYLIMKNGTTLIGLFQGMFEKNIMTFNPGWDQEAKMINSFEDVRDIQKSLKANNISIINEADESTSGPASFFITDPDGNQILIDQHV